MLNPEKSPFILAASGQPAPHTPVWFMRQAGRSLPEYRQLRKNESILDSIAKPEMVAEITLQPVKRYGVDAAILFSDIMVPLHAIGAGVEILEGRGPVVAEPYKEIKDVARLRDLEPEADTPYVLEAIQILIKELEVPLIGFAGAPFTLASYLIEGGASRTYAKTKAAMYESGHVGGHESGFFQSLISRLTDLVIVSLISQVQAGVSAIQLFDSWVGILSPTDYKNYILPHTQKIFSALKPFDIPMIHFGVGTGELLELMASAGPTIMGVDWRVPLSEARKRTSPITTLQGNLDPTLCLAPQPQVSAGVFKVLEDNAGHPGHIFNLGHGVLQETNPDTLKSIVEQVHTQTHV